MRLDRSVNKSANRNDNNYSLAELYTIPHGDSYLVYAPFEKTLLQVNHSAAKCLQNIDNGTVDPSFWESELFTHFKEVDILKPKIPKREMEILPDVGYEFRPKGITLLLTSKCSMRCTYCYSNGGDHDRVMPWEVAKAAIDWIVDNVSASGGDSIFLSFHGGGELVNNGELLKKCVRYARRRSREQNLVLRIEAGLNGVMDRSMIDWIVDNLDGATVSLDGLASVQNRQRPLSDGGESFGVVSACLRRMDAVGFNYGIRTTVTRESLDVLEESVECILRNFGAKTIQVEPVSIVGRAERNDLGWIDSELFVEKYRKAREMAKSFERELKYSGARFGSVTNKFCKAAGDSFVVTEKGILTSCYEVADAGDPRSALFFFGRYDRGNRAFVIDHKALRQLSTLTADNKPHCRKCFCKWSCAGDCAAKLALLGDAWDPSPSTRCHINRELTKDQMIDFLAGQAEYAGERTSE